MPRGIEGPAAQSTKCWSSTHWFNSLRLGTFWYLYSGMHHRSRLFRPYRATAHAGIRGPCGLGAPNFFGLRCRSETINWGSSFTNARPGTTSKMAAFVKAINAKIRANPALSYFCSTRKSSLILSLRPAQNNNRPVIGQPPVACDCSVREARAPPPDRHSP